VPGLRTLGVPWYAPAHMVNAEVTKTGAESALSTIRKFTRRVQGTGLVQTARKRRYYERPKSRAVAKKRALKRIQKREDYRRNVKEGKIIEAAPRYGRGRPQQKEAPQGPARFGEDTPIAR